MFAAVVPGIDSFSYFYTLFMTPLSCSQAFFFRSIPCLAPFYLAFFTPLYHLVNICRSFAVRQSVRRHRQHGLDRRGCRAPLAVPVQTHEKKNYRLIFQAALCSFSLSGAII